MIYFGLNDELAERLGLEATSEFSNVIKHIQAVAQSEIPPIAVIDLGTATVKPPLVQALVRVAKEKTAYAEVLVFVPREDRPQVEHEYLSTGVNGVFSGEAELQEYLDTKRRVFSTTELLDDEDIDKLLEEMTGNLEDMLAEGPTKEKPTTQKLELSPEDEQVLLQEVQEREAWEILWREFERRQEQPEDRPAAQRPPRPQAGVPVEPEERFPPVELVAPTKPAAPGEVTEPPLPEAVEEQVIAEDLAPVGEETPPGDELSLDLSDIRFPDEATAAGMNASPEPEEVMEEAVEEVGETARKKEIKLVGPTPEPVVEDPVAPVEPGPVVEEPVVATEAVSEAPDISCEAAKGVAAGMVPHDILREVALTPIAVREPPCRPKPVEAEPLVVGEAKIFSRGEGHPVPVGTAVVEQPIAGDRQRGLFSNLFGGKKKAPAPAQQAGVAPPQPTPAEQTAMAMDRRFSGLPDATLPPQTAPAPVDVGEDEFSAKALDLLKIQRDPSDKPPQPKKALLSLRGGGKPAVRGVAKRQGVALEVPIRFNPPKLITVFSPKGGVGKTTVTLNMGAQLALGTRNQVFSRGGEQHKGLDVVVVDMDLFQGGAHYRVADITEPNMISLIQNISSIHSKEDLITNYLLTHRDTRLRLLLRPATPSEARSFTDRHLTFVLKILLLYFDLIILDCPPEAETKVTEKALELADLLLLVTEPENVSLTNARRMLPRLLQIKQQDQVKLIVNKWTSKCGISWEQITRWFNYIETIGQIPEHTEFFMASANTMSLPLLAGNKSVLAGYVNLGNNVIGSLNKLQRGRARPMMR